MSCEGAIYKSAGSRSVQAEHKRRPLDADSALRTQEHSRSRRKFEDEEQLHCGRTSGMEGQFQVPAILCPKSIPVFLFLSSWGIEESGARKKNHCSISGVFSQGFCFCCCCWWCLALDTWDLQSLPRILEMLETVRAELNLDLIRPFRLVGFPVRDSKHAIPFD